MSILTLLAGIVLPTSKVCLPTPPALIGLPVLSRRLKPVALPAAKRVVNISLPVKLVSKPKRTLSWNTARLALPVSLPKASVTAKIASPFNLVVVEN